MKTLLLILLISFTALPQTLRYVSPAGDNSNGESWATAWQTFGDIVWNDLDGGNSYLYISGGEVGVTDSVEYKEMMTVGASGSWNSYIYIMAGKYSPSPSGHSGRAIIDGDSTRPRGLYIDNIYWLYVKGLEVRHHYGGSNGGVQLHHLTGHIVIDSCMIYENAGFGLACIPSDPPGGGGQQADISTEDSSELAWDIEIKNCRFWTYANNSNPNTCDDLIQMKIIKKLRLHDNFFWNRNKQIGVDPGSHAHQDGIQVYISRDVWIYNNIFVFDSAALGHPILIGAQSGAGNADTAIIYNNFIAHGGDLGSYSVMSIYVQSVTPYLAPTFIYHNTVVCWNGRSDCLMQEEPNLPGPGANNLIVRNNLMVQMGTNFGDPGASAYPVWRHGYRINFVDSVTNNLMWSYYGGALWSGSGDTCWVDTNGDSSRAPTDWDDWINNFGGTGVSDNPDFIEDYYNIRTEYGYRLQSISPAIDVAGTDAKAFIESKSLPWTDLDGQTRDELPDIGAFEYQQGAGEQTSNKLIMKR